MIKLKNVSKFYYSKGIIATGFTKVNLEFNIGEFVAITGESGSGKSTLLNVISGLDTYEEGEMYINGKETSHYSEQDFENYRRIYISNIFQNFNLVNSYTVYQNIELVLLLNGKKKKEIKKEVLDLIKKVGLYKFRNSKVSKLSGGQKQRVAIARALAKSTPIIIADEPTGNLDKKSAEGIIKLLSEISKDKLVIIVTHNYEQVEPYVTRKIKMHDGRVLEDKKIKDVKIEKITSISTYKNITLSNKIRLGVRNAFNIVPKFLLILFVYLFMTLSLVSEYASSKKQAYIASKSGYNYMFSDLNDKRIVIKKNDNTSFSDTDFTNIENIENVDYIIKNDLLLDREINITDNNNFWIYGNAKDINQLQEKITKGKLPENDNEIVLLGSKDDYYLSYMQDELIGKELYISDMYTGELDKSLPLKVVGIVLIDSDTSNTSIYVRQNILNKLSFQINQQFSEVKVNFEGKNYSQNSGEFRVVVNSNVPQGQVYMSKELNYLCDKENCIGKSLSITAKNIYYTDTINLTVTNYYTKKNLNKLLGLQEYDSLNGAIFINQDDYNNLFNKATYQSSIYVKDINKINETNTELQNMGLKTLLIKDTLVDGGSTEIIRIFRTVVTIILIITLFFISYFVIRIILKSRNVYYSTIRMLGATKKISIQLLIIELLTVFNTSFIIFLISMYLNYIKVINIGFLNTILEYLKLKDYITLYIILVIMSLLISIKFSKKLFKKSAISTIKEEV